jgi:hypothetical protein
MLGSGEEQTNTPILNCKEEEVENVERRRAALLKYKTLRDQFFPEVPEITGEELLQLVEQGAVGNSVTLVDCRSDAERKVSFVCPPECPHSERHSCLCNLR